MAPKYDPTKQEDWQIAEIAEEDLNFNAQCDKIGILPEERIPYGRKLGKVDYMAILERLKDKKDGYYIDITAMTPTPLGEGKTVTTMGLIEGLGKRGVNVGGAIRQPSGGPTMNIKGSAAGGGIAQLIPLTDFSLGLTGDINAIMIANNLAMVAVTSRLQHEFNYNGAQLAKIPLKRLNIDPLAVYGTLCVKCPVLDPVMADPACIARVAEEIAIVSPKIIVTMGEDALYALDELMLPLAHPLSPRIGEIQQLTPQIAVLHVPNIDQALDDERSKRAFWASFRLLGDWYAELPPY